MEIMEKTIRSQNWEKFGSQVNEYLDLYSRIKPVLLELGGKEVASQLEFVLDLLLVAGINQNMKNAEDTLRLLPMLLLELQTYFQHIPHEVGLIRFYMQRGRRYIEKSHWDNAHIKTKEIKKIVLQLCKRLKNIGEEQKSKEIRQKCEVFLASIKNNNIDEFKMSSEAILILLEKITQIFSASTRVPTEFRFMIREITEVETALSRGHWEIALLEAEEGYEYMPRIIKLLKDLTTEENIQSFHDLYNELPKLIKNKQHKMARNRIKEIQKYLSTFKELLIQQFDN
jgi:hypothetical protein